MADIIEIIHQLSFEITGRGLDEAVRKLKEQAENVDTLKAKLAQLQKDAKKVPAESAQEQQLYTNAIAETTKKIGEQTDALKRNFQNNKQLQKALIEEIGLIEQLTQFVKRATEEMNTLTDPEQVRLFAKEIREANLEISNLTNFGGRPGLIASKEQQLRALREANSLFANPADIAKGNQQEKALEKQISNLRKLGIESGNATGAIGKVNAEIDILNKKRIIANENELPGINRELQRLQARLKELNNIGVEIESKTDKRGLLSQILGSGSLSRNLGTGVLQGLGIGAGYSIVTRLTSEMAQFAQESAQAYREVEGVRIAFERLGKGADYLQELRDATKGTVSDLTLMQYAVQARNFEVPLSKLSGLFRFAQQRARETGVEVDYLVKSIITGIGRESPRILDNLGINVRTVREEFNRTGDYATAVFNVIEKQGAGATNTIATLADEQARLNAEIANMEAEYGKFFAEAQTKGQADLIDFFNFAKDILTFKGLYSDDLAPVPLFGDDSQIARVRKSIELTEQQREQEAAINRQAESIYKTQFERFNKEIETADFEHKERLIKQQKELFNQLIEASENGFLGILAVQRANATFLEQQQGGSILALGGKKQRPIAALGGLTLEQLGEAKKEVQKFQDKLTEGDTENIQLASKYYDAIDKLEDKITNKKEKTNRRRINLEKQLWQEINRVQRENALISLRDLPEADTFILEQRNQAERDSAMEQITIRENAAREQGELTLKVQAQFAQLRKLTQLRYDLELQKDSDAWWRNRVQQEAEFYSQLQAIEVSNLQAELEIQIANGVDTLKYRQQLGDAQLQQELSNNSKEYDARMEAARKMGKDTTDIEQEYADKEALIRLQATRRKLQIEEDYYQDRLKLTTIASNLLTSEINVAASDEVHAELDKYNDREIGLRRFLREQNKIEQAAHTERLKELHRQATEELRLAEDNLRRLRSNPNASGQDLANAQTRVNTARTNATTANANLSMNAGGQSGFNRFLFGNAPVGETVEERRQRQLQGTINLYNELASTAVSALNTIYQAEVRNLDAEIGIRERRVEAAKELAERGNAQILQDEQNRLNESIRQREVAARRQQQINAALTVSESLVAIASAASQSGAGALVIVPAVIAALASGFAAVRSLSQESTVGFETGGYTGDGHRKKVAGVVHKGEFVINQDATAKNRDVLEAINNGANFKIPQLRSIESMGVNSAGKIELTSLEEKTDTLIEAVEANGLKQTININERGFGLRTEKLTRKNKARHKR